MNLRKLGVTFLTGALVFANSIPAMASTGFNGDGTVNVDPDDVISVVVPTSAAFDFNIDGSKLLYSTEVVAEGGSHKYANETVLFTNTAASSATLTQGFTNVSDVVKIVNKSSCAVNFKLTAKVTNLDEGKVVVGTAADITGTEATPTISLTLSEYEEEKEGETLKGYKKLTTANDVALTAAGADFTLALASDADEYTKSAGTTDDNGVNKWTQKIKSDATGSAPKYFVLTGNASANREASGDVKALDWSTVSKAPKVEATYVITKTGDDTAYDKDGTAANQAPSVTSPVALTTASTSGYIAYSLGSGTLAATAVSKILDASGSDVTSAFDLTTAGRITFTSDNMTYFTGNGAGKSYTFKIVFNDTANTQVNAVINVSAAD